MKPALLRSILLLSLYMFYSFVLFSFSPVGAQTIEREKVLLGLDSTAATSSTSASGSSGSSGSSGAIFSQNSAEPDLQTLENELQVLELALADLMRTAALSTADWFRKIHSSFMIMVLAQKNRLNGRIAEIHEIMEQRSAPIPILPADVTNRYEISILFKKHLSRSARSNELDHYATAVNENRMTLRQVESVILASAEYNSLHSTAQSGGSTSSSENGKDEKNSSNGNTGNSNNDGKSTDLPDRTAIFRIMTQNVKALPLMSAEKVRHDIELTASQAGIIGWQEIGPDYYKKILESLPQDVWQTFWGNGHAGDKQFDCPISWKRELWKKVDGGSWELHPPHAKISLRRYYNWVVLKNRRTGAELLITNKHYVAGAWNDTPKPFKELRPAMWREGMKKEVSWLEEFMKKHPEIPIVLLGDYNANHSRDRKEFPEAIGGRKLNFQVPERSIDLIILINGKGKGAWHWEVENRDGQTMPGRHSDHQGRRSAQRLVRAK